MKHAIILAHPAESSLNAVIAEAYSEVVVKHGHEVVLRDLYRMRFDPCLHAAEIPGPGLPVFRKDVIAERERLADVQVFTLVYPFWFNAPPAILKGYIDRVFGMGFGFEPVFGGNEPRLCGRRLLSFTTSGAPDYWVRDTGALRNLTQSFDTHLAAVCGLTLLDHIHFGGIVANMTAEAVEEVRIRVRTAATAHFRRHPPAVA